MGSAGNERAVDPQPRPEREPSPKLRAVPFDPGPGRYDERRAKRAAKQRERAAHPGREPAPVTELRARRSAAAARIDPGVQGPVRKRARAAENRRRVATRRRGLFLPPPQAGPGGGGGGGAGAG